MTGILGAGFSAAGSCPAGFGDIVQAPAPATDNLIDDKGIQRTARAINPITGDYILRASGRAQGVSRSAQLVLIRLRTILNSSSVANLGLRASDGDRSAVIDRRTQANITDALQDLVDAGIIELISVTVNADLPWRQRPLVRWRDLSTGAEEQFP
jgi:hypothetical protein